MTRTDGYLNGTSLPQSELNAILDSISGSKHILAVTHANPDADAVASVLAFADSLVAHGRTITCAVGDGVLPDSLRFLPGSGGLSAPEDLAEIDGVDLVVMLDCADRVRIGPLYHARPDLFDGSIPLVNIDHHITNAQYGSINLVDPNAAATCEILAIVLLEVALPVNRDVATCLLAGIYGDTLALRTPSTTGRTLRVAAGLLDHGADLHEVVDHLFRLKPFSTVKLWAQTLDRAEMLDGIVWTEITSDMLAASGATPAEGEGIVNFLAGTKGTKAAILMYQQDDGWRVSLRSITDEVDVAALAQAYGGGGHSRAAGCRLPPGVESRDTFLKDIATQLGSRVTTERF